MTLGDILKDAAFRDLAGGKQNKLVYTESFRDGQFHITLRSDADREAFITCSAPDNDKEEEYNYLRAYFLSMAFNAAIYGMKRKKQTKK